MLIWQEIHCGIGLCWISKFLFVINTTALSKHVFIEHMNVCVGGVWQFCFTFYFIRTCKRLLFPTSERCIYAWHSCFRHIAFLPRSKLFVAVVTKKLTTNVKRRSHFDSYSPACEWANASTVTSSNTDIVVVLIQNSEGVFISTIPCLMELK